MARRIRAREVLRLRSVNGLSQNAIARTAHVSKHSVQDVLEAARKRGVSWEDVEGMSEEAAYALLFPGRGDAGPVHADPDWARVHRELARTGVTLKLLHAEYADGCALAKAACARRVRSCYVRQPDLEDLWRESRDRPGGERKLVRKYGAFGLLVIDEWLLDRPDTEFRSMLLELMELRYGTASTVFCTQFKKKDWHPRLGGGVHADAIMDRIVHNAVWVDMGEANMRQRRG